MLELPENPDMLISETEHRQLHEQWSTIHKVVAHLTTKEGFIILHVPSNCPGYLDISTLTAYDSRTLTREFARYKEWRDFTAQRLMFVKMILIETKNEMRRIYLKKKQAMSAAAKNKDIKKPSLEDIKEATELDPRYTELTLQLQEHEQYYEAYSTEAERYKSSTELISRQITLRGQELEKGTRAGNIGAGVP